MTPHPLCCVPDDTVRYAAKLMKDHDVGPLVVINDAVSRRLEGILTDRDITVQVVAEGADPNLIKVREVMTRATICCRAEDDVHHAVDLMEKHKIRRIPIVDHHGVVVGIIAQADIATRLHDPRETARVVETVSRQSLPH
jgi:CBS domain-containing protein